MYFATFPVILKISMQGSLVHYNVPCGDFFPKHSSRLCVCLPGKIFGSFFTQICLMIFLCMHYLPTINVCMKCVVFALPSLTLLFCVLLFEAKKSVILRDRFKYLLKILVVYFFIRLLQYITNL